MAELSLIDDIRAASRLSEAGLQQLQALVHRQAATQRTEPA